MSSYAKINFQPAASPAVPGYLVDSFLGFAQRGNGLSYGWVTEATATDADGTTATPIDPLGFPADAVEARSGGIFDTFDPRLTTFAHTDLVTYPIRAAWEIAVPNGHYEVTVAVGDTDDAPDSMINLLIEGQSASEFVPTALFPTELVQVVVEVTDGFLTLAAPGGTNTELQYIEIDTLVDLTPLDAAPAPDDYPSFSNLRAAAQDGAQVFEVLLDPATGFAENVDPAADIFLGVDTADGRTGISLQSLSDGSIRLYETLTGIEVAYSANTTAGADSVTISPEGALKENTSYTLVVDGATDRGPIGDDLAPTREFLKVGTTFVTGEARETVEPTVAFSDVLELDGFGDGAFGFTSVTLSPDKSHLYVSTITGEIKRWALDPVTGAIDDLSVETFTPGGDFSTAAGSRGIIGLTFDPTDPSKIWITDNWPIPLDGRDNAVPEFSGRISTVTLGADDSLENATVSTYITGLPRSNGDHVTNSLTFRENPEYDAISNPGVSTHLLYINQGSNTAMGAPDNAWGLRPERLLTAAVLEIDPYRTPPTGGFDVTTEPIPTDGLNRRFSDDDPDLKDDAIAIDSGPFSGNFLHFDANGVATVRIGTDPTSALVEAFYDPTASDAVLKIFATGTRNAYDLVWHSNGSLYVPTNGSAAGGSVPDDPSTPQDESLVNVSIQPDYIFRVQKDGYYGHPNELRDEYILNGGNPTAGEDTNEVTDYAPGVAPDPNYQVGDAYDLGFSRSPNGVIEYTSDAWGAALQGALIFTEYSGGNDLRAITFGPSNEILQDFVIRDFDGNPIDTYIDPLDIVINPDTGQIYMITLNRANGASQIVRLDPSPAPVRIEAEALTLDSGFQVQSNGAASGAALIQAGSDNLQSASLIWEGPSGLYTLSIGHFDENDGVSQMITRVNGVAIDAFLWDQDRGSAFGNAQTLVQENQAGILIETGDHVSFSGMQDAGEPLRIDYVEFAFTGLPGTVGAAPVNTAPTAVSTTANEDYAFTGLDAISVSDTDSTELTVTAAVTNGTLTATGMAGLTLLGVGTETLILSGTPADINAALSSLVFTPMPGFVGAADVTVTTSDGAQVEVDTIAVTVDPFGDPDADIVLDSLDPVFFSDRLHFSYIDEPGENSSTPRQFKDSATLRIHNEGSADLDILDHTLTGPYVLQNPTQLDGLTISGGGFVDVTVLFDRASFVQRQNNETSVVEGTLTLSTNDLEDNFVTANLATLWQRVDEGSWEPNVNEIWEAFGFGNTIPGLPFVDTDPSPLNQFGIYQAFDNTEVLSPYWRIADGVTEARITHIAQYASPGGREVAIHRPFAKNTSNEALRLDSEDTDTQQILPNIRFGGSFGNTGASVTTNFSSATFTNQTIPDNWRGPDYFGIDIANFSSDPTLNSAGNVPSGTPPEAVDGHWVRIFQALDSNGDPIANTYLAVQDFSGSNGDYNDNLVLIEGVTPVSLAPTVTAPTSITLPEEGSFAFTGENTITITDPDPADMTREFNFVVRADNGTLTATAFGSTTISGQGTGVLVIDGVRNQTAEVLAAIGSLVYTPNFAFDGPDTITITGNDSVLSDVVTIDVTVEPGPDNIPTILSITAPDVTVSGAATFDVIVKYDDDEGLDLSSFDVNDIRIVGPGGGILTPTSILVSSTLLTEADVTYTFAAPGGSWDLTKNGTYDIEMLAGQVFDTNASSVAADASAASFDAVIPVGDPIRIEAEALTVSSGFQIQSNGTASNGQYLQASNSEEQRAGFTFNDTAGTYDITIGYFDENDGQSTLRLLVNGFERDVALWDLDAGNGFANAGTLATRVISDVVLRPGDVVEIAGFQDAGEPLRTDYIDLLLTAPVGADAIAPVVQMVTAPDLTFTETGATQTQITVTYADDTAIDAASIDVGDIVVTGPGGPLTVTAATLNAPGDGTPRTVTYTVAAPGGDWDTADNGIYTVSLVAGEVLDTSANAVAAAATLDSFTVAMDAPPPAPFRIEAEAWTPVQGFVTGSNGSASNGQQLQASGSGQQIAEYVFTQDAGRYDVTIGHFDESDGQSTLGLYLNGVEIETWTWDVDAGSAFGSAASLVERVISDVAFTNGDVLSIRGVQDAGEPLRTDYFDFDFLGSLVPDDTTPVVQSFTADDLDADDNGAATISIEVTYADLGDIAISSIDISDLIITGPTGALTVSSVSLSAVSDAPVVTATYIVNAPGGSWDASDDGTYTVMLATDAVTDATGNSSGAAVAIGGFDVGVGTFVPPDPFRVEAETLTVISGFSVGGNGIASAGQYLQAGGAALQEAEFVFNDVAGKYTLDIGHFDESDGQSTLNLLVNGAIVDTFVWNADPAGPFAEPDNQIEHSLTGLQLTTGDVIRLSGTADGAEALRVDYIDFTFETSMI